MEYKIMLTIYITLNIICVLCFLIRTLIWFIKKEKRLTFKEYVIYNDLYELMPDIYIYTFIGINGISIFFIIGECIYNFL